MQAEASKAGYGLVLALQVTLPCTRLTMVQSLSAEYPDHPRQMFRLEVSDVQTAVALEDGEQDVRWASFDDLLLLLHGWAKTDQRMLSLQAVTAALDREPVSVSAC